MLNPAVTVALVIVGKLSPVQIRIPKHPPPRWRMDVETAMSQYLID